MFHIAILITVHNRKSKTLKCLDLLYKSIEHASQYFFEIFLTDDKSSDGTFEAIKKKFPKIHLISGNGNLFWGRGMIMSWKEASKKRDYDYYVWVNDDSFLFKESLSTLVKSALITKNQAIISGALASENESKTSYGGKIYHDGDFLDPNGQLQEFNFLNGNFVIVSKSIFKEIGTLDYHYKHGMGDYDYGLRAKKAGFNLLLTNDYVGTCERHDSEKLMCYDVKYGFLKRIKFLYSPFGPNPIRNFKFYLNHFSLSYALGFMIATNALTIFPLASKHLKKGLVIRLKDFFYK